MILITSSLILLMVSVGHGNPMPEPNPDPNLIIQVSQVVHRRYCNKPHDQEGPHGHPVTETPLNVDALEKEKEELEASIIEAEKALNETKEEVEALENEVAEKEAEAAALDDVADVINNIDFGFRRKRASAVENVKDILGELGDHLEESHRKRRSVISSVDQTITYCQEGEITDTGFNLWKKVLTDLTDALKPPRVTSTLICVSNVIKELKTFDIQFTVEEKATLKDIVNGVKAQAETAKEETEKAVAETKAKLETKKTEKEALEKDLEEKVEEKEDLEDRIEEANKLEPTDPSYTTIKTSIIPNEVTATTYLDTTSSDVIDLTTSAFIHLTTSATIDSEMTEPDE